MLSRRDLGTALLSMFRVHSQRGKVIGKVLISVTVFGAVFGHMQTKTVSLLV